MAVGINVGARVAVGTGQNGTVEVGRGGGCVGSGEGGRMVVTIVGVITGPVAGNKFNAASNRMRGFVMLFRWSVTGTPLSVNAARMTSTLASGALDFKTAHAPLTNGADMEVPLSVRKRSSGTDELMVTPGANSERKEALLEKGVTLSD